MTEQEKNNRTEGMKRYWAERKAREIRTSNDPSIIIVGEQPPTAGNGTVSALELELKTLIDRAASKSLDVYDKLLTDNLGKIIAVKDEVSAMVAKGGTLNITVSGEAKGKIDGLKHQGLSRLVTLCANNLPVLLVGMAGTGKTHAGEQVAQALDIPFYAMSVGAQTSKSDIIGYMNASGNYTSTLFRKAYESGGVFLMDEIDAGNSNVLIQINAALSNNYCAFPDGMVKRHADFRFIATANTFGLGASRMYVGRNQLDAATLDRFSVMNWNVDKELERMLVSNSPYGTSWLAVVHACRNKVQTDQMRALVTPRATLRGVKMLMSGVPFDDVLVMSILNGIPTDKHDSLKSIARAEWLKAGGDKVRVQTRFTNTQATFEDAIDF